MMHLGQFHHGRRLRFQLRQLNGIALLRHFFDVNSRRNHHRL